MTKVTDTALLKMLNEGSGKVSDPSLLSKLNSSDPIDSTVGVMKPQAWDNAVPNYVALAPTKSAGRGQRMPDLGTQHNPFPRNQYGSANEGDFVKNQDGSTRKKVMSFAEKRLAEGENALINLKSQAEGFLPSNIIKSASDKVSQIDATGGYYIDNGGMSIYVPASEDESSILKETMKPQLSQLGSIQTKYDLQRQNVPLSIDRAKFNEEFENSEGLLGATKAIVTNPTAGAGFLAESLGGSAPAIALSALTRNPFALMAISGASGYEQELATGIAGYLDTHGYPRETWDSLPEDIIKSAVDEASTRALVVWGVEAFGGKIASKAYVPKVVANSPTKAAILNPMAQGVAGGVIDATGEATAQLASGQPYNPQEIVAEAGGGLLSQPMESLQSTVHAMKLQGKNFVEVASNEELLDIATNPTSPKEMALEASLGLMNRGMAIDNNGNLVTSAEANAQPTQPLGAVGQPTVPTPIPVVPEAPEPVPVEVPTSPTSLGEVIPVAPTVPSVDDVFGKPTQLPVQEPVQQGDTTTPPLTGEVTVPVAQPLGERRQDTATRKRMDEMSQEELKAELSTSEVTGGKNKRAYNEAEKKPIQVFADADGLKKINDTFGHEAGDKLIQAMHSAMSTHGIDSFHLSGDEFAAQFDTVEEASHAMELARDTFAKTEFTFQLPDGTTVVKTGLGFSYGTGQTLRDADNSLYADKKARKESGLRTDRQESPDTARSVNESAKGNEATKSETAERSGVVTGEQKQTKLERDSDKGRSDGAVPTKADEGTLQDTGDVGGSTELLGDESGQASKQDAKAPQSTDKEVDGGSLNDINPEAIGKAIDRLLANAPPLSRINARLALKRAEKLLADGKITQEQYNNRISRIIENMDDVAADKRINKNAPTVRGELWIREKLLNAQRNGEISKETAEFAEWFIKQNPSLVDNLGISVRTAKGKDEVGNAGGYEIATRIMTLFNGSAKNTTAVHEVLHHLERMMPKDMQESIKKEWVNALQKALTSNDPVMKEFAENIVYGGKAGLTKATNMMREGKVDWKHYGLFNPSEYWAVNMTDTLDARYKAKDSVIKRTKAWLKEALEHIKSVLGMDSNSPLLKALNKLIKEGDGKFTDNPVTLSEQDGNLNDIAEVKDAVKGTVSTIEGFRSYMMDSLTSRAQALEKKVPELHKLFNKVIRYAGMDKRSDKTFSEYIEQQVTIFHNRVENIIQDAFGHDKQLSEDENNQLRDAILGLPVANQAIADAGKKLNHEMELIRAEAERLGIPIGEVTDIGYMPRVYKTKEIHENPTQFKADAYTHFHDFEFEHEFGDRTVTYSSIKNIARFIGLLRNFQSSPTIKQALKDVRKQTRLIKTSKDASVRQQAFAEAIRLLESVRSEAQALYAEQRSQAWVNGARMKHDMKAFETNDARPKPTRERKLMGVADITMKDWLEQDVRYLLDKLNTVMAKKMALYNAYGKDPLAKIDSTLNNLVLDNKITLEQREEVGQILRDALGINREGIENNSVRKFGDMGHALGYTAMLERAIFPSLFEASAYAFRSGSMKDVVAPFRQLARVMFNQRDKVKTKELALLMGIVARNAASNVNLHRIGISEGEYSKLPTKILHGFFKLNFLQTITDDQRVLGIRIGTETFKKWAKQYQNGSQTAKSFLDEHGINDTDAFATWIRSLPDIPTGNDIFDVDGRMTPMGQEFSTAIHRFISGAIQNPDATLKPAFASHPVGKYFAGIMSFAFSAYENIFKREAKILARVPANEKAQRLAMITLPTLVSLFVAQTIISALRMILDGKDPDDDDLWEEAMYRGGANVIGVGMFNQISNYIMGTKYESSAAETVVGAVPSYFLKSVDNINKPLSSRNSEDNETAENKMGKGIYDFAVAPLVTGALSLAPSQAKWLARIGLAVESSKQSRERFAEMFGTPPERENSTDKKFKNYTSGGDKAKELVSKKLNASNKDQWDAEFEKVKAEYPELLNGLELKRYADNAENDKKGRSGEPRATPSGKPMLEGEALTENKDELKEISTINSRLDDLRKNKNATYNDIVDLVPYSKKAESELDKLDDDGKADEISRSLKIEIIKEAMDYRTDIKKQIMKKE